MTDDWMLSTVVSRVLLLSFKFFGVYLMNLTVVYFLKNRKFRVKIHMSKSIVMDFNLWRLEVFTQKHFLDFTLRIKTRRDLLFLLVLCPTFKEVAIVKFLGLISLNSLTLPDWWTSVDTIYIYLIPVEIMVISSWRKHSLSTRFPIDLGKFLWSYLSF